jgi:hypothetical protein
MYDSVKNIPGDIVECGVFKGTGLYTFLKLKKLFNPNGSKKVIGFDFFDTKALLNSIESEQDKKAMGELLTEIQEDYQNEANEYYILSLDAPATFWQDKVNKIHNLLTQCGITHIIH